MALLCEFIQLILWAPIDPVQVTDHVRSSHNIGITEGSSTAEASAISVDIMCDYRGCLAAAPTSE